MGITNSPVREHGRRGTEPYHVRTIHRYVKLYNREAWMTL